MNNNIFILASVGVSAIVIIAGITAYQFMQDQNDRNYEYCLNHFWEVVKKDPKHSFLTASEDQQIEYCRERYNK